MSSCLRQHIPGVTLGIGFLGNPSPRPHAVDTYSEEDLGEWAVRYSVPEPRLSLRLGSYCSPGYFGMQSGSFYEMSSQPELLCFSVCFTIPILGQANNLRRLVDCDDDSDINSCSYPCATMLDGVPG